MIVAHSPVCPICEDTLRPQIFNQPSTITAVASGAVLISFSSIFVKLSQVGPGASGFYRMLFGTLALVLTAVALGQRPRGDRISGLWAALAGLVFAADLTVWHRSILSIGPGLATVLANFQVFVMIGAGSLFLREQITHRTLASVILALFGLFMLVGPGWNQLTDQWRTGVSLGLATALFYAVYILLLRRLQANRDNAGQIWNMAQVAAWTALFMGLEVLLSDETFLIPNSDSLWCLVAYGVLCQALGWLLISRSLPRVTLSVAGITILLQPALAFVWDILFFARPTSLLDLIGATITLTAIYIGVTRQKMETDSG